MISQKKKVKIVLRKFAKILSKPAFKTGLITSIVVAIIASGATALALGFFKSESTPSKQGGNAQVVNNQADDSTNSRDVERSDEDKPLTTSEQQSESSTPNRGTASPRNADQGNDTLQNTTPTPSQPAPAPAPAPDPTYLTTCIYISAPHENEYCPYKAPPAWNTSTVKYACGGVPCPTYNKAVQMYGSVSTATNGYTGEQWLSDAKCYFLFPGNIQRAISMNLDDVVSYWTLNNTRLEGYIDCLTARPI